MVGALKALGVKLEEKWDEGIMIVEGCGGRFPVEVRDSSTAAGQHACGVCVAHAVKCVDVYQYIGRVLAALVPSTQRQISTSLISWQCCSGHLM